MPPQLQLALSLFAMRKLCGKGIGMKKERVQVQITVNIKFNSSGSKTMDKQIRKAIMKSIKETTTDLYFTWYKEKDSLVRSDEAYVSTISVKEIKSVQ